MPRIYVMVDEMAFLKRQAERKGMTEREFCIYKIGEWKEKLEIVSDDYRELSEEEFHKRMEQELD